MIETNNIYYASYLACEGLALINVERRREPRFGNTVYFSFKSDSYEHENEVQHRYKDSYAHKYITSLDEIRDVLYRLMNERNEKKKEEGKNNEKRTAKNIRANRHCTLTQS